MTKKTKEKSAAQFELFQAMLDAIRNSTTGKLHADNLFTEVRKRNIDPRLVSYQSVGALFRSMAKAGFLALIKDEVHTSNRHSGNTLRVWKIVKNAPPKS